MAKSLLLGLMGVVGTSLGAQTVLFTENFDSYTAGSPVAQQTGETFWDTWSSSPGGAEDANASDAQANSGSNSMHITGTNDMVLLLDDKTSGRYQIEFDFNVASGKVGYYNLLQNFAGANSEWGMQVFLNADGTGTVDAGGASAGTFDYTQGSWTNVNMIVDLDDDFATMYVDGNVVVNWNWTGGSYGDGTTTKLDAVNFYAWTDDDNNTSDMYVDDIVFTEQVSLEPASNLATSLNGSDIAITWDAPSGMTADDYLLMRNDSPYQSGISATNYDDMSLYPSTYEYGVRAHYDGLGYSPMSNTSSETVAGGTSRNAVAIEVVTGTWCPNCPGAAMAVDQLHEEGADVLVLEYHGGDTYEVPASSSRISYYGTTGYPTGYFDGGNAYVGGSQTVSSYPGYLPRYEERIDYPSVAELSMTITHIDNGTYNAEITGERISDFYTGDLVLRTALTESHIAESWMGLSQLDFVVRDMYPSAAGQVMDFSSSDAFTYNVEFTIDPSWVKDNCEFGVFIQHESSKEIVQASVVDMSTVVNSIEDAVFADFEFYPNPSNDVITVKGQLVEKVVLRTVSGQLISTVYTDGASKEIDVSDLSTGLYLLEVTSGNKTMTKKLLVK